MMDWTKKVSELNAWLLEQRRLYNLGTPPYSDDYYDTRYAQLDNMVAEHDEEIDWNKIKEPLVLDSPGSPSSGSETVKHRSPMLSLKTFFDEDDALKFLHGRSASRLKKSVVIEPKLDGVSVSILYRKIGTKSYKLESVALRGDGERGEVVDYGCFSNLPLQIPKSHVQRCVSASWLVVKGEAVIPKEQRDHYTSLGYKSLRNTVAGILRRKKKPRLADVDFVCWQVVNTNHTSHIESLDFVRLLGFDIVPQLGMCNLANLDQDLYASSSKRIPWETDGVVVKFDDKKLQARLKETSHHPNWAFAFKKPQESTAKGGLVRVEWQVGRTGRITPVGILAKPVKIHDASISRVTLHNADHMYAMGIKSKCRVLIERRGGVIPKVVRVVRQYYKDRWYFKVPTACPSCGYGLLKDGAHIVCNASSGCYDKIRAQVIYITDLLGIKGINKGVCDALIEANVLNHAADIFALFHPDLRNSNRESVKYAQGILGKKIYTKLCDQFDKHAKRITLSTFLQMLCIQDLGKQYADAAAKFFKRVRNIEHVQAVDITKYTQRICKLMGLKDYSTHVQRITYNLLTNGYSDMVLRWSGVTPLVKNVSGTPKKKRYTSTIMFTGTLSKPRKQYCESAEQRGYKVLSGVSKNLKVLIVGKNPAKHKVDKAKSLGCSVVGEQWFRKNVGFVE
jgi:DNA ligase (NAD+)